MVLHHNRTLIMDNGGHSIKMGWNNDDDPRVFPNAVVKGKNERKRVFVGEELSECTDRSSLYFLLPCEKGYIVNWGVQQQIWERSLRDENVEGERIVLTHPNILVPAIKDESTEILFELFRFDALFKSSTSGLIVQCNRSSRVSLVIDCGFSFTHIVPSIDGKIIQEGVIRMDIGGKILTNQLKEWISYRELNVVEETYVMNECKEDSCFVSLNFGQDMNISKNRGEENSIVREYVLPDFSTRQRGLLRIPIRTIEDEVQKIRLNVERFALPEILFNPSDIGINQMGIAECVVESVNRCPKNIRIALLQNIHILGGSTQFPHFIDRLLGDISSMVESEVKLSDDMDGNDPITRGWRAGKRLVNQGILEKKFVTKAQYDEEGEEACRRSFFHFISNEEKENESLDKRRKR